MNSSPPSLFDSLARLDGLNPPQREATEHFEGPILVLAGAGSGKTRVLTTRISHLVAHHGVPPDRILAVTFTNKAAGEMRERVAHLLGAEPSGMWIGTFHALGARMLRRHAPRLGFSRTFSIFDQEQSLRAMQRAVETVGLDPKRWSPKAVRAQISAAKNQLIDAQRFARENEGSFDIFARNVARVFPVYQDSLREQNALDFDDLLVQPVALLESAPDLLSHYQERFAFLLVDEYQDTNRAQFRFLELLAAQHRNLMVVGDDDQSIYGWRGADIRNILDFEKTYPGAALVRLEQNYRSTGNILAAANAAIAANLDRKGKTLFTDRDAGEALSVISAADEMDEARTVVEEIEARQLSHPTLANADFAVLYRTNAQSRALEEAFRRRGIPYQIVGGVRFYERREIQDALAYLRLIANPQDQGAFERIINVPRRGIGAKSLERINEFAAAGRTGLLEACRRAADADGLGTAAVRAFQGFAALIERFAELAKDIPVGELVQAVIEETDLLDHYRKEGPEGDDRVDNVRELIAGALDFDAEQLQGLDPEDREGFSDLDLYLQRVALVADIDSLKGEADTVTLMTLHNAKGLEFPAVFITGLEDGLFPLSRAYDQPAEMEEERRLFYVGLTRAMDKLILCHARQRRRAGEMMVGRLSPFVDAIPEELLDRRLTERARREYPSFVQERRHARERRRAQEQEPEVADFEYDFDQDRPRLLKGERVSHATFGSGTVVEVSGFGHDLKVTVDFTSVGRKKLLARYADLQKDFG
ncbi:MAG: UvrD-helicase domain-containing protein [Gemmatimonadota bacterium]